MTVHGEKRKIIKMYKRYYYAKTVFITILFEAW